MQSSSIKTKPPTIGSVTNVVKTPFPPAITYSNFVGKFGKKVYTPFPQNDDDDDASDVEGTIDLDDLVIISNQLYTDYFFKAYLICDDLGSVEGYAEENYIRLQQIFKDQLSIPTFEGVIQSGLSVNWRALDNLIVNFAVIQENNQQANVHEWKSGQSSYTLPDGYGFIKIKFNKKKKTIGVYSVDQVSEDGCVAVMIDKDQTVPKDISIQVKFVSKKGHMIFHTVNLNNMKRIAGFRHNKSYQIYPSFLKDQNQGDQGDAFLTNAECTVASGQTLCYFEESNGNVKSMQGNLFESQTITIADSLSRAGLGDNLTGT